PALSPGGTNSMSSVSGASAGFAITTTFRKGLLVRVIQREGYTIRLPFLEGHPRDKETRLSGRGRRPDTAGASYGRHSRIQPRSIATTAKLPSETIPAINIHRSTECMSSPGASLRLVGSRARGLALN